MSSWSNNNRAHTQTWFTLRVLNQSRRVFPKSGDIKMKQLTFFNPTASKSLRRTTAAALASEMNNIFRLIFDAKMESGIKQKAAIKDMTETLVAADKTMSDLAGVNDDNYKFLGEPGDV